MLTEGIHNISANKYHSDPVIEPSLSRSIINTLLNKTPRHAFIEHPRLNPDYQPDTGESKFDIGTAAHSILLEGVDNVEIIYADDWRKKENQQKRNEAREQGKIPLLEKHYDQTIAMVQSAEKQILNCSDIGIKSLNEGESELTFVWVEIDQIGRKSYNRIRPDWISNDYKIILDYKTTGTSADPNEYLNHVFRMGYDVQEAYYRRGVKALTATDSVFIFVGQETAPPYLCSFIGLSPAYQAMGNEKVDYGIFWWNQCMQNNDWPAYPSRICWIEPPAWALGAWELKAQAKGI